LKKERANSESLVDERKEDAGLLSKMEKKRCTCSKIREIPSPIPRGEAFTGMLGREEAPRHPLGEKGKEVYKKHKQMEGRLRRGVGTPVIPGGRKCGFTEF